MYWPAKYKVACKLSGRAGAVEHVNCSEAGHALGTGHLSRYSGRQPVTCAPHAGRQMTGGTAYPLQEQPAYAPVAANVYGTGQDPFSLANGGYYVSPASLPQYPGEPTHYNAYGEHSAVYMQQRKVFREGQDAWSARAWLETVWVSLYMFCLHDRCSADGQLAGAYPWVAASVVSICGHSSNHHVHTDLSGGRQGVHRTGVRRRKL